MFRWIIIAVLAIGVIASGVWGYQEHQEKNAILVQAENNYQRSFHDLSYHIDLLHDKLGTTLAMNTKEQLSPQLVEIWRLTSEAHTDVGQLPLTLLPFNKTEEFLSEIGEFSYRTAVRDLENEPLTDDEVETLQSLYETAGDIEQELRNVQNMVLEDNLRWMDVQLALATEEAQADNTIINGFKTVEKTVKGYSEGNMGATLTGTSRENHEYRFINGEEISEEEALEQAKKIFQLENSQDITIAESGDGAELAMYSASYRKDDKHGYIDLSKKGGNLLSLIVNRDIKDATIGLHEGMGAAEEYLKEQGFENMEAFQSSQYENVGVYNFISKQGDVRIYPDSIQVKVALDDGEIIGLSARDYFRNHKERDIPEPEITEEEAREKVNPNVEIHEQYPAVIENELGEEVLAYQFLGTLDNDTYRIYINANTGVEEQVDKLKQAENKF
ncbi:germination protein YpeB [Aquibacillus sediminis]|uniref:germination protein YpeB n=1 Tax=Aquibacillus sediminis TaxID=2574734 RepID=UPI001108F35B|nr:germination protein YpeB [Aquibacillus sediminis]